MIEVGERIPIPARTSWSARLDAGASFRIIDVEGGQAADLFVYNPAKPTEYLSGRHTRVHMGEAYPRAGWTFVSNQRRPMLEFTEDTSPGRHDCLVAACDQFRVRVARRGLRSRILRAEPPSRGQEIRDRRRSSSAADQRLRELSGLRGRQARARGVREQAGRRCNLQAPRRWHRDRLGVPPGHRGLPARRTHGYGD